MDNGATWTSWGPHRPALSPSARAFLTTSLGSLTPQAAVDVTLARLPETALASATRERLAAALGADAVVDDARSRAEHAGGQAYSDLVRRRRGDAGHAPDVVLVPHDATGVAAALDICSRDRVAVVPWGGGTSVVGGLDALRGDCVGLAALDLVRLDQLLDVDRTSLTATFQPGIRTPAAEALLAAQGLTLGHVPQSYERASLGGYVVTRSAGQASSGYGRIDDLLVGCRMATPAGELVLPAVSGSAAGPDLRRLVLGSEGTLGVVTEVTLRVRPTPAVKHYEGWVVPSWDDGLRVVRRVAQELPKPDIVRLSDPEETRVSLELSGASPWQRRGLDAVLRLRRAVGGCMVILGFEGAARDVRHRRREARRLLRAESGVPLGTTMGRSWEHHRFSGPYLRDTLLDSGVLVETLETATTWRALPSLYDEVRSALRQALRRDGRPPLVGCHVSHLYATGASLYFTVLAAADPGAEVDQWARAKQAANAAIVAAGGTASHHHAVGTAHRPIVEADLGGPDGVGVAALRAVKATLDPAGVLNPGKLLP